jgi:hypothetical protein
MVKVLSRWPAREQKAKAKVKAESKVSVDLCKNKRKAISFIQRHNDGPEMMPNLPENADRSNLVLIRCLGFLEPVCRMKKE